MESNRSRVYEFLSESRYKLSRNALLVVMLVGCSFGQVFLMFGRRVDMLGYVVPLFVVLFLLLYVLLFYLNTTYLVPRFLLRNQYVEYFALFLVGCVVVLFCIKTFVTVFLFNSDMKVSVFSVIGLLDLLSSLVISAVCVASSLIPTLVKQWLVDTRNIGNLENRRLQSSIDEFKSHINAELLYDIIGHASEEVKRSPGNASKMIISLSELLSYELYDCKRAHVVLGSDIEFIRNYLSLAQQVSQSFAYSISVKGNTNLFVRPFQFLSFVQEILRQQPESLDIYYEIDRVGATVRCEVGRGDLSEVEFMKLELDRC